MTLRRQAEHLQFGRRVPVGRIRRRLVVGKQRVRHVGPEEGLEGADLVVEDLVARVDRHAVLAGEEPEAEGVVGASDRAAVVEVETGRYAGVGGRHEAVWVADRRDSPLRDRQVILLEQRCGYAPGVEVELVDQQHVGPGALDDLGHRLCLGVGRRRQVGNEISRIEAVERGVEGGELHRGWRPRVGGDRPAPHQQYRQQHHQQHGVPASHALPSPHSRKPASMADSQLLAPSLDATERGRARHSRGIPFPPRRPADLC